eukprot:Clim_evm20s225 gene=Clim_evmTU20s225
MRILVHGAGAIGSYVGARLQHTSIAVEYVGRDRIGNAVKKHGFSATCHLEPGQRFVVPPGDVHWHKSVKDIPDKNFTHCIVAVKSLTTHDILSDLALLPKTCQILSFQNGLRNEEVLKEGLPGFTVVPTIVGFNVAYLDNGSFHQGTDGGLTMLDNADKGLVVALRGAGVHCDVYGRQEFLNWQWGKLMTNLSNSVNALSGVPYVPMLGNWYWRAVFSYLLTEAVNVCNAMGVVPKSHRPIGITAISYMLVTPTWLYRILSSRTLDVDDKAVSSMLDDIRRGNKTEIDFLNGEVVRSGEAYGVPTPCNAYVADLVKKLEQDRSLAFDPEEVYQAVKERYYS